MNFALEEDGGERRRSEKWEALEVGVGDSGPPGKPWGGGGGGRP